MNGRNTGGDAGGAGTERGQSEVLGMVLLLGMVIAVGVTVVFFGIAVLDLYESQTIRENVHQSLDSTVETMSTVVADGDEVRDLPLHDDADASAVDDGAIRGGWFMDSDLDDGDPPALGDIRCNEWEIDPLGALTYEYEDRHAVIQSGGIWEYTDDDVQVYQDPTINFVGTNASTMHIDMNVMQIDSTVDDLSHSTVRADSRDDMESFPGPSDCSGPTPHALIEIESSYADAWYTYLESSTDLGTTDDDRVTLEKDGDVVRIVIQDFADVEIDYPRVTEDHGMEDDQILTVGDEFEFFAEVENSADEPFPRCDFIFSIEDTGFEIGGDVPPGQQPDGGPCNDLQPGESAVLEFFTPDAAPDGVPGYTEYLEPGSVYDYTIYPQDEDGAAISDGELDDPGSFYYGEEGIVLNVSEPTVDGQQAAVDPVAVEGSNVTLAANVHNIGVEDALEEDIDLDVEVVEEGLEDVGFYDNDTPVVQDINRSYGQEGVVAWELNASLLASGEHEFTVSPVDVDGSSATGHFVIEEGIDPEDTELFVNPNTQINVTVVGTEMQSGTTNFGGPEASLGYPIDRDTGVFTQGASGYGFDIQADDPDTEGETLEPSDGGGWVDPSGSQPESIEDGCFWTCDYAWDWSPGELEWDDEEGYDLEWTEGGSYGWSGDYDDSQVVHEDETEMPISEEYEQYWSQMDAAVTSSIVTTPVDEDKEPIGSPQHEDAEWADHGQNLNVHKGVDEPSVDPIQGSDRPLFEHSFTTEERVSLQIEGTSYTNCDASNTAYDFSRHDNIGEDVVWRNQYCDQDDIPHNEFIHAAADPDEEETQVRVVEDGDELPQIESGSSFPNQWNTDELLDRQVDVEVDEDNILQMSEDEYIFLFTLGDRAPDHWDNDRYWQEAFQSDDNPNFNDLIVHVDIVPGDDPEDTAIRGLFDDELSETDGIGVGGVDPESPDDSADHNVDSGNDRIVIG